MIDKLNEILKGIDKDQCEDDNGWWETICGAEFGANKLKEVQDLVKKLTLTDVSQQRELLIDYSNYLCKEYFNRHLEPDDCDVDEYLKSINCG